MFHEENDPSKWVINEDNYMEFIEALRLDSHFDDEDEALELIKKHSKQDVEGALFDDLVGPLA